MTKIFAAIMLVATGAAWAEEISGLKVKTVRAYTSLQGVTAARNFTVFTVDRALSGTCTQLYISSADKEAFSE